MGEAANNSDVIVIYARVPKELWEQVKAKRPEFKYLPNSSIVVAILAEWLEKL